MTSIHSPMRSLIGTVCTCLLLVGVSACTTLPSRLSSLPEYSAPRPVTTMKVPYPIVLLHGLGQKADVWNGAATKYFTNDLGLSFGGVLKVEKGKILSKGAGGGDADFYVVNFSDPHDSIDAWSSELDVCMKHIIAETGADRAIIIGYSMGGLAARSYLTKRYTDHRVKRLITVGTPHLGSPFARVWTWKTQLSACAANGNVIASTACSAALSAIQGTEGDVPYNAPAVRDLRRPEDGGVYLQRLGKLAHPLDVEYVSVVGEVDMVDGAQRLTEGWIQELLRKVLSVAGGGFAAVFEPGDGVVSAKSQNIMNIEYFTVDQHRRRAGRVVTVPSVHVEHLQSSIEVQRIALEEKPEYRGSSVVRVGDSPYFILDITDHIPTLCTLELTATLNNGTTMSIPTTSVKPILVRTRDGIVARYGITLPESCVVSPKVILKYRVTNGFGYTVSGSAEW